MILQAWRTSNINFLLSCKRGVLLLKNVGININTLPVLDVRSKGSSAIIGDRAFSDNAKIVSQIGDICIEEFHNNKIATVIKHIPGHGLAKVDSHKKTPTINKELKYLKTDICCSYNKWNYWADHKASCVPQTNQTYKNVLNLKIEIHC